MKKKATIDRSMKAHSPGVRFGDSNHLQLAAEILRSAGFRDTDARVVIEEIGDALFWCKTLYVASADEVPRPSEELADLRGLLANGNAFYKSLAFLSPITRSRLFRGSHKEISNAGSSQIEQQLREFLDRARLAMEGIVDVGGAPKDEMLPELLKRLAVVWCKRFPNDSGVTRSGSRPRYGNSEYQGPLLDFVEAVLQFENVEYSSRRWLGELLSKQREAARQIARTQLAKPTPLSEVLAANTKKPSKLRRTPGRKNPRAKLG